MQLHPCEAIYHASNTEKIYGTTTGVCRITGKVSRGVPFEKWVKPTFTDHAFLYGGSIISNEALFCFDEQSEYLQIKTGRDRPQRFRTYSHIIDNDGAWHCYTKADKRAIFNHVVNDSPLICLAETGQKHILFKHQLGSWQIEDQIIPKNLPLFQSLHANMCALLDLGFSQSEIGNGQYYQARILKAGLNETYQIENQIKLHRSSPVFDFAMWMLFTSAIG